MRNIGPKSLAWLEQVGIHTKEDLLAVGVVPAFLMVEQLGGRPSLNLMWALEGGSEGIDWRTVSKSRKRQLLVELAALKRSEA